jgi:hypothetical protein
MEGVLSCPRRRGPHFSNCSGRTAELSLLSTHWAGGKHAGLGGRCGRSAPACQMAGSLILGVTGCFRLCQVIFGASLGQAA